MLEDPLQKKKKKYIISCGLFQIYFYENLFFVDNDNKIHDYKKLNSDALEILLNRSYSLNQKQKNEKAINEYIKQQQINLT